MTQNEETTQDGAIKLLRFLTCGSVDDGKSTLIGRLLFDSKQLLEDQLAELEVLRQSRGEDVINLANLTDGLRAEREQGITIDVAHRFFATPHRRFIVADTPGHVQYTRNMVTAASTSDLAIILIDARKGVIEQTRRHSYLATLLGIRNLVLAINKIDLVQYSEEVFVNIQKDFLDFAAQLGPTEVQAIPVSALLGDNVVDRSNHMPWYHGPSLLEYLEHVEPIDNQLHSPIFPVQWVVNPQDNENRGFRAYAGQVASGEFSVGDQVRALPSGRESTISRVSLHDKNLERAIVGQSVMIELMEQLDLGRGTVIVSSTAQYNIVQNFDAIVCWMAESPLNQARTYVLRHAMQETRCRIQAIHSALDIHRLEEEPAAKLSLNDIGRISVATSAELVIEPYKKSRALGAFTLIDEQNNQTVAAGMVTG